MFRMFVPIFVLSMSVFVSELFKPINFGRKRRWPWCLFAREQSKGFEMHTHSNHHPPAVGFTRIALLHPIKDVIDAFPLGDDLF